MFYICIQTKFYIKTFTFVFKQSFISKHLPLYSNKVLYQNIYLCIQTKFYIKTFTFVFRQCFIFEYKGKYFIFEYKGKYFIFEYKGKCFIFEYKGKCFISKHLPLCSDNVLYLNTKVKVLYQNIYIWMQTLFCIKKFILEYRLRLYQNIYT